MGIQGNKLNRLETGRFPAITGDDEMPKTKKELVELIDDPVCRQVMSKDGVQPTELFNMMRTVHPVIAGDGPSDSPPEDAEPWIEGCERRKLCRSPD